MRQPFPLAAFAISWIVASAWGSVAYAADQTISQQALDLIKMEACRAAWNYHVQVESTPGQDFSKFIMQEPTGTDDTIDGVSGMKFSYSEYPTSDAVCGWLFFPHISATEISDEAVAAYDILRKFLWGGSFDVVGQTILDAIPSASGKSIDIEQFRSNMNQKVSKAIEDYGFERFEQRGSKIGAIIVSPPKTSLIAADRPSGLWNWLFGHTISDEQWKIHTLVAKDMEVFDGIESADPLKTVLLDYATDIQLPAPPPPPATSSAPLRVADAPSNTARVPASPALVDYNPSPNIITLRGAVMPNKPLPYYNEPTLAGPNSKQLGVFQPGQKICLDATSNQPLPGVSLAHTRLPNGTPVWISNRPGDFTPDDSNPNCRAARSGLPPEKVDNRPLAPEAPMSGWAYVIAGVIAYGVLVCWHYLSIRKATSPENRQRLWLKLGRKYQLNENTGEWQRILHRAATKGDVIVVSTPRDKRLFEETKIYRSLLFGAPIAQLIGIPLLTYAIYLFNYGIGSDKIQATLLLAPFSALMVFGMIAGQLLYVSGFRGMLVIDPPRLEPGSNTHGPTSPETPAYHPAASDITYKPAS